MAARFQEARDLEVYLAAVLDNSSDESEEDVLQYGETLKIVQGQHGRLGRVKFDLTS